MTYSSLAIVFLFPMMSMSFLFPSPSLDAMFSPASWTRQVLQNQDSNATAQESWRKMVQKRYEIDQSLRSQTNMANQIAESEKLVAMDEEILRVVNLGTSDFLKGPTLTTPKARK